MSRLLLFTYFVEAGLLLLVVPWSVFWERNFFLERVPALSLALANHYIRGAISGVGVLCLLAALAELATLLAERRSGRHQPSEGRPGTEVRQKPTVIQ